MRISVHGWKFILQLNVRKEEQSDIALTINSNYDTICQQDSHEGVASVKT